MDHSDKLVMPARANIPLRSKKNWQATDLEEELDRVEPFRVADANRVLAVDLIAV